MRPSLPRVAWGGLAAVLALVGGAGLYAVVRTSAPVRAVLGLDAPMPVYGAVPAFFLTERSGRRVGREDLEGAPWVADFIFTRCRGVCPALSTQLARLQRNLEADGRNLRLVSFSVDPENDTPEALAAYARRFGASDDGWWFLTGDRDALYALIGEGFRLNVAQRALDGVDDPNELITHSDRFVLVDRDLRVRGYYRGTDPEEVERLESDLRRLLAGS